MNKYPVVSVIIPTYDMCCFISKAVDSLLNQSFKNIEIIVVDDGSNDETENILKKYIDNDIIIYIKQKNSGSAAARNSGVRISKGKYICFLDADDVFEANSVQDRLNAFKKYPNIGLLCTDFKQIILGNDNEIITIEEFSRKKFLENDAKQYISLIDNNLYLFHKKIFYDPLALRRLIWTGTVMIPKNVFECVGYFDEKLSVAEDIDLWFRIAKYYKIAYLSSSTATYYIHSAGITQDFPRYYNCTIHVLNKYLDSSCNLPEIHKTKIVKKIAAYYFTIGYYYYSQKFYRESSKYFKLALIHNKFFLSYYKYTILTLFPDFIINIIRNSKKSLDSLLMSYKN